MNEPKKYRVEFDTSALGNVTKPWVGLVLTEKAKNPASAGAYGNCFCYKRVSGAGGVELQPRRPIDESKCCIVLCGGDHKDDDINNGENMNNQSLPNTINTLDALPESLRSAVKITESVTGAVQRHAIASGQRDGLCVIVAAIARFFLDTYMKHNPPGVLGDCEVIAGDASFRFIADTDAGANGPTHLSYSTEDNGGFVLSPDGSLGECHAWNIIAVRGGVIVLDFSAPFVKFTKCATSVFPDASACTYDHPVLVTTHSDVSYYKPNIIASILLYTVGEQLNRLALTALYKWLTSDNPEQYLGAGIDGALITSTDNGLFASFKADGLSITIGVPLVATKGAQA